MRLFTQNVKVEALKRAPLFEGLSKKELRELARATEDLSVGAGTVLCREGSLGREFFVIVDGVAKVTKGGKRLATRQAGDFFGEIAALSRMPRTQEYFAANCSMISQLRSGLPSFTRISS